MDQRSKERRNKKTTSKEDNLDAVKAAAHAWLEHGSSSSSGHGVMNSFYTSSPYISLSRSLLPAADSYSKSKPSRFKIEAAVRGQVNTKVHCSLLDEYEVERIVQDLDDYTSILGRRLEAAKEEMLVRRKERRSSSWARRGLACSTNVNDVVVATRRISKSKYMSGNLKHTSVKVMQV